jgi:hypothetical protein
VTAQVRETISVDGEQRSLCALPLALLFRSWRPEPRFMAESSANWRGYRGSWEIVGTDLSEVFENEDPASNTSTAFWCRRLRPARRGRQDSRGAPAVRIVHSGGDGAEPAGVALPVVRGAGSRPARVRWIRRFRDAFFFGDQGDLPKLMAKTSHNI